MFQSAPTFLQMAIGLTAGVLTSGTLYVQQYKVSCNQRNVLLIYIYIVRIVRCIKICKFVLLSQLPCFRKPGSMQPGRKSDLYIYIRRNNITELPPCLSQRRRLLLAHCG